ncbi:hypothetical protein ACFW6E_36250 [Streptomyces olivaceoviridis]|uniref:hypothetical protein n=1 Tax=Streptomyces olivaceoviridis TaxID=1921 RepID=UPI0036BD6EAD
MDGCRDADDDVCRSLVDALEGAGAAGDPSARAGKDANRLLGDIHRGRLATVFYFDDVAQRPALLGDRAVSPCSGERTGTGGRKGPLPSATVTVTVT